MFNSIKKDKNRRHLVKKFEIQRLQNKVLLQAISGIDDNFLEKKKDMKSKALVRSSSVISSASKSSKTNFLVTLSRKIEDTFEQKIEPKYDTLENTNKLFVNLKGLWQKKVLKFTPRNSSKNRVRNRCIDTGRSRSVLRFCKLSRICLRDKASRGLLPGVKKASW